MENKSEIQWNVEQLMFNAHGADEHNRKDQCFHLAY